MSQANLETMRRFVDEVINKQCLAVIDELVHPQYLFRSPGQELKGRQALKAFFTGYHDAMPDLKVDIDDLICVDDKAVLVFTLSGTHANELMGIPATGKQVAVNGMTCSRFEEGQIIEEWELLDQLSLFQQLGIVSI